MAEEYYTRDNVIRLSGAPYFYSEAAKRREREIAKQLETAWGIELHEFPRLFHMDWYAAKDHRVLAWMEIKCRSHASDKHDTVWLNFAKWCTLTLISKATKRPAYFIAAFTDGPCWIPVANIDASQLRIDGFANPRVPGDREIIIDVPVQHMGRVKC